MQGLVDVAVSTLYVPSQPISLQQTLAPLRRGTGDPTFVVDASGTWRTMRTPEGAATLLLASSVAGVRATAWGPGAEWAIASVPELLGSGDNWNGLDVAGTPLLATALRRNPGLRLARTGLVLEALIAAVLEQKVTTLEARRAWRYLVLRHGDEAPGPAPAGMRVVPSSESWRRIASWEWHRAGVGPQRAEAAVRVASIASSLERTIELGRGGPEVERMLRSVPGVGVWTAAETMQRAHGDPDSVSVGDYHLAAYVGWALIGRPVDDDGMLELLEQWRGHRQRIVRLIMASGFRKPRFGPRMTIQDHRFH